MEGVEDTMGVSPMKKEVKGGDETEENHGEDKTQISAMEDECNASVDNIVECSVIF